VALLVGAGVLVGILRVFGRPVPDHRGAEPS